MYLVINGTRPEQRPTVQYHVKGASEIKFMNHPRALSVAKDPGRFQQLYPCEFDWSWEPDPGSPPYNYVFGNQYYPAEVMPTAGLSLYPVPLNESIWTCCCNTVACTRAGNWRVPLHQCEWDYTWRPEPGSPALYLCVWKSVVVC
jgi:hypothetical protein